MEECGEAAAPAHLSATRCMLVTRVTLNICASGNCGGPMANDSSAAASNDGVAAILFTSTGSAARIHVRPNDGPAFMDISPSSGSQTWACLIAVTIEQAKVQNNTCI
jgi:hypothetical protein